MGFSKVLVKRFLFTVISMLAILSFANAQSSDTLYIGEMLFQSSDSLLTIQEYEMPPHNKDYLARSIVAMKWGFRYDHSIGCIVQEGLNEIIECHNQQVYAILSKKYGVDWGKKFEEQVKSEYKKEEKIKNYLNKLPLVRKVKKDFGREKYMLSYSFEPDTKLEIYYVSIYGPALGDEEEGMYTFGKFIVDSKNLKVNIISAKVEKILY